MKADCFNLCDFTQIWVKTRSLRVTCDPEADLNRNLKECYDPIVQTEQIVALLIEERDRLTRAIEALQDRASRRSATVVTPTRHSGAAPAPAPKKAPTHAATPKRVLSAAGRRAIAEAARKRWAAIREAKKEKPAAAETKEAESKPAASKNNKKARG
jgi:hypothetical protein